MRTHLKTFIAIISLIAIDQGIKALFLFSKKQTLINDSGIFSLPIKQEVIIFSAMAILLTLFIVFMRKEKIVSGINTSKQGNKGQKAALYWPIILIFCGGASNILDRVTYGGVVDMIFFKNTATNIADIYIGIGASISLIKYLLVAANTARLAARMKGLLKEWIHHDVHQTSPAAPSIALGGVGMPPANTPRSLARGRAGGLVYFRKRKKMGKVLKYKVWLIS